MINDRVVLGLSEEVVIVHSEKEKQVVARIDTGATSSSIDSNLAEELGLGPITRYKIIKSASGIKERPSIKAKVKLGSLLIEEEFTLVDRSHMTYQILIGQNILKKSNFLIDPNKT